MKKIIITLVVVVLLAGAGYGAWLYMNQPERPGAGDITEATQPERVPPRELAPDSGTDKSADIINAVANVEVTDPNADFAPVTNDEQGL
jgi:flagellar basal body-associated protein FliL